MGKLETTPPSYNVDFGTLLAEKDSKPTLLADLLKFEFAGKKMITHRRESYQEMLAALRASLRLPEDAQIDLSCQFEEKGEDIQICEDVWPIVAPTLRYFKVSVVQQNLVFHYPRINHHAQKSVPASLCPSLQDALTLAKGFLGGSPSKVKVLTTGETTVRFLFPEEWPMFMKGELAGVVPGVVMFE